MKTLIIDDVPIRNYEDDFVNKDWTFGPLYNGSFLLPKINWETGTYYESATEEQLTAEFKRLRSEQIKLKYEFHKANGWKAYQDFRAKVVSDIYDGRITEEQAFIVESNLKVAYDRIAQNGDWKTARFELQQVNPFPEFVQFYYDLALNYINQYITENYED